MAALLVAYVVVRVRSVTNLPLICLVDEEEVIETPKKKGFSQETDLSRPDQLHNTLIVHKDLGML